ncbi:MAG: nucleoside-diphosphate sugar epimerase/dehydratase, partial [Anaerolineales bacterium]
RLKVVEAPKNGPSSSLSQKPLTNIMLDLTYKRRVLEIGLDFFLISIAYYLALWARFGFLLDDEGASFLLRSLPVAVGSAYVSFFTFGVYRGVWRYIGIADLIRFARSVLGSAALTGMVLAVYAPDSLSPGVLFLFTIFLLLGLAASRSSFKILDQVFGQQVAAGSHKTRVLIHGAADVGEIALRWIRQNPNLNYQVIGFLDSDPFKQGRRIHGIDVLNPDQLETIARGGEVDGIILSATGLAEEDNEGGESSDSSESDDSLEKMFLICRERGIWVRRLRFELELLG